MKRVVFPETKQFQPCEAMLGQLQAAPASGLTVGDMRKRIVVMDKIEAASEAKAGYVDLEDAEHETLREVFTSGRFGLAHRDILAVADAVESAKEPPAAPALKAAE